MRLLPPLLGTAAGWLWLRARDRRRSTERLAAATLEALLNAIDANDEVTGAHVRRVAAYALCIAGALELDPAERRSVERVALFHDIGKIHEALFDIVHDDERLSDEERQAIATHPARGAEVLAPLAAFYPELQEGVLAHHERWDGKGYPRGLQGAGIPRAARIVAVADSFDAITHSRRYHRGSSAERGAQLIREGRGTQFDPQVVDAFLSPAVFGRVEREMAQAPRPRPRRAERRDREREADVPEITFRWRDDLTGAGAPP